MSNMDKLLKRAQSGERVTCYNCNGFRYVWNGYKNIGCPVCNGTGDIDKYMYQLDLFRSPGETARP